MEELFTPAGAEAAYLLELSLRLEFYGWILSGEELNSLATLVLDANLPQGYGSSGDEIEIDWVQVPKVDSDADVHLELQASREIQASLSLEEAANLALGLSPVQAGKRLAASLPLDTPPQIALRPAWWPRLPVLPLRIHVVSGR